jgi:hypothetical protein
MMDQKNNWPQRLRNAGLYMVTVTAVRLQVQRWASKNSERRPHAESVLAPAA